MQLYLTWTKLCFGKEAGNGIGLQRASNNRIKTSPFSKVHSSEKNQRSEKSFPNLKKNIKKQRITFLEILMIWKKSCLVHFQSRFREVFDMYIPFEHKFCSKQLSKFYSFCTVTTFVSFPSYIEDVAMLMRTHVKNGLLFIF